ncbi:hypothetical protein BSKO_00299 [Bryopsis sp. KO-2023]|nr:hypothetical protein BSKO_00299 [Bryopsis sp. KO-2023]
MNMFAGVRAIVFYAWTLALSVPLFVIMMTLFPFVMLLDRYKRSGEHFVNNIWAKLSSFFLYRVEIEGRENLPKDNVPAVYIANHQSYLDIFTMFHLDRSFKFISKTSNFMIPIIGWSMFMTGHIMLNRIDRRSQMKCLKQCQELLAKGASVLFFPEGTRSSDKKLQEFKKGAFSVAVKSGVDVVPVTLIGTGDLMPKGKESKLYPGKIKVVVHPKIETKGADAQEVCDLARSEIASALPAELAA